MLNFVNIQCGRIFLYAARESCDSVWVVMRRTIYTDGSVISQETDVVPNGRRSRATSEVEGSPSMAGRLEDCRIVELKNC